MRQGPLIVLAAVIAAGLGLAASVAVNGPGALLRSPLGQGLFASPATTRGLRVAVGGTVPRFRIAGLDGGTQEFPVPGRTLLINYWASWCAPCREELPLLANYSRRAGARLEVVAIALDTPEQAKLFLQRMPLTLRVAIEPPGPADSSVRLGNSRGVLPFSVLIGPEGRLLKQRFGAFSSMADLQAWAGATE